MVKGKKNCSRCGKDRQDEELEVIDGAPVCARCLFGKARPFKIYPIGVVRNHLRRGEGFGTIGREKMSYIELDDSQKPFLYKLEDEKYITVVYYLHATRNIRSVFNRGLDGKKVGIFATRTPDRLSRIAIQDVKLIKVSGTTLCVEGIDAIDGSPVLDIKLYWSALREGEV